MPRLFKTLRICAKVGLVICILICLHHMTHVRKSGSSDLEWKSQSYSSHLRLSEEPNTSRSSSHPKNSILQINTQKDNTPMHLVNIQHRLKTNSSAGARLNCFHLFWDNSTIAKLLGPNRKCRIVTLPETSDGGRMGNNMFRVAALIGTALRYDFLPIIPHDHPLTEWFDLPNLYNISRETFSGFQAPDCCRYYNEIETLDPSLDWVLYGYMQSWRYFYKYRRTMERVFKMKDGLTKDAVDFVDSIQKTPESKKVCVHVRRGDMDHILSEIQGYLVADMGYIERAMDHFKQTLSIVEFIIVSDSINWCKTHLADNHSMLFSPFTNPGTDMALLMHCDHVIVTSGSFGWWGAMLFEGDTVYFADFPRKRSRIARQTNLADYYPSHWIGMT